MSRTARSCARKNLEKYTLGAPKFLSGSPRNLPKSSPERPKIPKKSTKNDNMDSKAYQSAQQTPKKRPRTKKGANLAPKAVPDFEGP